MANEEHLKILEQGVEVWDQWRVENYFIEPDLSKADLLRANLSGMNLSKVDLSEAYLEGANLSGANLRLANLSKADLTDTNLSRADLTRARLSEANLWGADLSGAILSNASLSGADLVYVDLSGADLSKARLIGAKVNVADLVEADLSEANLSGVYLRNADLRGANLLHATVGWSTFSDVDLSRVRGLDAVIHEGPSTIGIDTIYLSKGNIPAAFLRGAGVPDTFIAQIASLVEQVIKFYSCFISHSSKEQAFAERLHADLQSEGLRCWFAPEDMKIGDKIRLTLDESIRRHDKLLLVLSKHSIASQWVEQEVETALARERKEGRTVLFPIRLDNAVMEVKSGWPALIRNTRHIGDFRHWKDHDEYQKAFNRLFRDLQAEDVSAST